MSGAHVDIAVNHDEAAIIMHQANHPKTEHYLQSVFDIDPRKLVDGSLKTDAQVDNTYIELAWASPDCTHFSKASSNRKRKDSKIRGLAWSIVKLAALPVKQRPRVILMENVEEFVTWGPLDESGNPIESQKGVIFQSFVRSLEALDYKVEWGTLKASDFGAATTRERFFLIARCDGKPIVWPTPTHGPINSPDVINGFLQSFQSAGSVIDWSLPSKPVFEREKPLAANTINRIINGIRKFIVEDEVYFVPNSNGRQCGFIVTYYTETKAGDARGQTLHQPLATITAKGGRFALCTLDLVPTDLRAEDMEKTVRQGSYGFKEIDNVVYSLENPQLRMLSPKELYRAQGFPHDYIIDGKMTLQEASKRGVAEKALIREKVQRIRQKRKAKGIDSSEFELMQLDLFTLSEDIFIAEELVDKKPYSYSKKQQISRVGNSVVPQVAEALVRANLPYLCETTETAHREIV
jgi:DNA (cytosine-5)-methyltransferase 1